MCESNLIQRFDKFSEMKKTLLITAIIIGSFFILFIFNKLTSKKISNDYFAEVQTGQFEITVTATGELMAEKSLDIKGPEMAQGKDIHSSSIRIQDLIPEGTLVN